MERDISIKELGEAEREKLVGYWRAIFDFLDSQNEPLTDYLRIEDGVVELKKGKSRLLVVREEKRKGRDIKEAEDVTLGLRGLVELAEQVGMISGLMESHDKTLRLPVDIVKKIVRKMGDFVREEGIGLKLDVDVGDSFLAFFEGTQEQWDELRELVEITNSEGKSIGWFVKKQSILSYLDSIKDNKKEEPLRKYRLNERGEIVFGNNNMAPLLLYLVEIFDGQGREIYPNKNNITMPAEAFVDLVRLVNKKGEDKGVKLHAEIVDKNDEGKFLTFFEGTQEQWNALHRKLHRK